MAMEAAPARLSYLREMGCSFSLRGKSSPLILSDLPITKTIDEVIVHHSDRLHVRINDRRADEAKSPVLEVLAECVGFGRSRRNLSYRLPSVKLGPSLDKTPAVGVKVLELFLNFEECACVAHCRFDLHPVANDLRIRCELLDLSLGVMRDFLRIEFVERAAITFPLFSTSDQLNPACAPESTRTSKCLRSL